MDDIKKIFGPRWAYFLQGAILAEKITGKYLFPSKKAALRDSGERFAHGTMIYKAWRDHEQKARSRHIN